MEEKPKFDISEFESIDLASQLMIPTEEKNEPTPPPEPPAEEAPQSQVISAIPTETETVKIPLKEIIPPEDSATYIVNGVEAIVGILGTAIYSIKGMRILTAEQKKIVKEAELKTEANRTDEEKHLILYKDVKNTKLQTKVANLDFTDTESIRLHKTAKGMAKVKGWNVGPDFAFWITLADILSDRIIDGFMD